MNHFQSMSPNVNLRSSGLCRATCKNKKKSILLKINNLIYNWSTIYLKSCCLTVCYARIFAYSSQCCFMYDWFVLFVCTVTKEPHQSQLSVWHTKRYTRFCEAKRLFVQGFYVVLPPSLSLPSEQSVSVATSHPSPLHPDWQMQCQTFWSRMHLPLLLQSPGQPSVNTSCTCQTAEPVGARKSGGQGEGEGEDKSEMGNLDWTGAEEGQKW